MAKEFETWAAELQKAIDSAGDAATVVSVLTQSRDDYRDIYAELKAAEDKIAQLTGDNERLTDTNRELYLRIGKALEVPSGQGAEQSGKSREETIKVEDLFKEEK